MLDSRKRVKIAHAVSTGKRLLPLKAPLQIQSNLHVSIGSIAQNAIHLAKHPLIEQPLSGDLQSCP